MSSYPNGRTQARHNGARDGWPAARIAKLVKLLATGMSYDRIAAELHVSKCAVSGKVNRLGLATRASPIPAADSGKPRKPTWAEKARATLDPIRTAAGHEPLPAMHPISWSAINR